jgi:light-regulated signal transduction histidine kinase (bacteriophytochrome)
MELSLTSYKNQHNQLEIIGVTRRNDKRKEREIQLQKQQQDLQKLQDTRDKFFDVVGNELKNPISAIINTTSLVGEYYDKMEATDIKKNLQSVSNSADHLYKLFDNLLQ